MVNIDDFNKDAEYVIFDDFEFEYMPNKKAWWGAQKTFTMTDKYHRKVTINWGKPLIYICNPDQDPRTHRSWCDFFSINCIQVDIINKLY